MSKNGVWIIVGLKKKNYFCAPFGEDGFPSGTEHFT
jgi:hypothetical protein